MTLEKRVTYILNCDYIDPFYGRCWNSYWHSTPGVERETVIKSAKRKGWQRRFLVTPPQYLCPRHAKDALANVSAT